MTTASGALTAIRSRLEASGSGISIPMRFHGDQGTSLPDTPSAFAFIVLNNQGSGRGPTAFGGGSGANLYRNEALLEAWVFAPSGEGMNVVMDYAETIAARMRSFRDSDISCFSADVIPIGPGSQLVPPGLSSEVSNYQCACAEITLHFDQIG